jgi:hypothetical protein
VYTARWGTRAQAIVFFAMSEGLFVKDGPIADQAVKKVVIPTTAIQ